MLKVDESEIGVGQSEVVRFNKLLVVRVEVEARKAKK
jgi:hypothetical protein